MNLHKLLTEQVNPNTTNIDTLSSIEIAQVMNAEDEAVVRAVKGELPSIAKLVDAAVETLHGKNGRVFYVGTGSSGRLGVLDASEIPPTFNFDPNRFIGIIAGGDEALRTSMPTVEDSEAAGVSALEPYSLTSDDLVIGLTASGRTPFVRGALEYAKSLGTFTGLICCNKQAEISPMVDVAVEMETGPEVIAGSTRLKAGTAQKMVLNIFSTATMIRLGKVYQNLMVDLEVSNEKLRDRAIRIIMESTGAGKDEAAQAYAASKDQVKVAIVFLLTGESVDDIEEKMVVHEGRVRDVLADWGFGMDKG